MTPDIRQRGGTDLTQFHQLSDVSERDWLIERVHQLDASRVGLTNALRERDAGRATKCRKIDELDQVHEEIRQRIKENGQLREKNEQLGKRNKQLYDPLKSGSRS
jgi:uncharacterized coiled-coil DUF342 family protein